MRAATRDSNININPLPTIHGDSLPPDAQHVRDREVMQRVHDELTARAAGDAHLAARRDGERLDAAVRMTVTSWW